MLKKTIINTLASFAAIFVMFLIATPVHAQVNGMGPYGDIEGYYTWTINEKGVTVYSQNGTSWVYDNSGNRVYLDGNGNKKKSSSLRENAIIEYNLKYYATIGGVEVFSGPDGKLYTVDNNGVIYNYFANNTAPASNTNDLVVNYVYTSADGTNVYQDVNGKLWYFWNGYYPYRWYGNTAGAYWSAGVPNRVFRYAYVADGHTLYRDDSGMLWWFANDNAYIYGGNTPSVNPSTNNSNVDWTRANTMWADGKTSVVYVGQSWQAPAYVSWCPDGMHLVGWDYAENTGYARWKPGQYIKNTGNDLALYPVYAW